MKIKTFGEVDERSRKQLETCMKAGDAELGVLCADHHPGYSQPIGGAVAYEDHVSPSGVGYDIGCGNKAVRTDVKAADLDVAGVMAEIEERISFGMGVPAPERADHPVLDQIREAPFEPQRKMLDLAAKQLGTVGSGNHYVNLFADEEDTVWIGVHFGSRGFGHKTATGFLAVAQGLPFDEGERKRLGVKVIDGEMDSPPVLLGLHTEAGQGYIEAMSLAGDYAYAGRDVVVDKVLEILGARSVHAVHNHHNFAWLEAHFGRHVVQLATRALDEVRREHWNELRRAGEKDAAKQFKDSRWSLLKNPADLTERQADTLAALNAAGGKVPRAWAIKELVRAIFAPGLAEHAVADLIDRLLSRLSRSRLKPFVRLGRTIRKHREGILAARRLGLSNARAEALNNKVKLIVRRAYGFHSPNAATRAHPPHLRTGHTHPPTRTHVRVTSPTTMPAEPETSP